MEFLAPVVDPIVLSNVHNVDMVQSRKRVYFAVVEFQQMKPTSNLTRISLTVPKPTVPNQ